MVSDPYEVRFTSRFQKDFHSLKDSGLQERVRKELETLSTNAYVGKRLHGNLKGFFSLRVGDYRIVYAVKGAVVTLYFLGHRKGIYDRH